VAERDEQFLWGAATASYQIEGFPLADGAGASIWHEFSHRRGKIRNSDTGDVACDHYHRFAEDIEQMQRLGLSAYRFSVAWPRVYPEPGRVNPQGLDFYSRLVDALLARGITPLCTLFHWDTPLWLQRRGGFARRESLEALCAYGRTLFDALGDRVRHWVTINEPIVYAAYGHLLGRHAPGQRLRVRRMFAVAHHLLLGHARLVRMLRQLGRGGSIGIVQYQSWNHPLDPEDPRDVRAAQMADQLVNRFYMDPLLLGGYPPEALRFLACFLPRGYERDLEEMLEPGDFVGLNYYESHSCRHSFWVPFAHVRTVPTPGVPRNVLGWEIDPEGLYRLLRRLREDYGNPRVYVTENGLPLREEPGVDPLEDEARVAYLEEHIRAVQRARREGARVEGYFVWSLMDNFEWAEGYAARFGLLRVDYDTLARSWRRSAHWYRRRILQGVAEPA
jgi:beta-glucosidase